MGIARARQHQPAQDLHAAQPQGPSLVGGRGNGALADRLRRGGQAQAPRPLPFRSEMEAAFGQDFGDVRCFFGQAAAMGALGAGAAAQGEVLSFATERPAKEQVAHELTHVVQQRGSRRGGAAGGASKAGGGAEGEARDVAQRAARGEAVQVSQEAGPELHGDWLDDGLAMVGSGINAVGDALDARGNEAQLDAEEELAVFRGTPFAPLIDNEPSSGLGMFDVAFDAAAGRMVVTLKVSYSFVNGTPAAVAPGFRPEEFQWTEAEKASWKARYQAEVGAQWSDQYTFRCTRPFWTALAVACTVQVVEDAADPHFVLSVSKLPPDAGMDVSSICEPGFHHDGAGGTCPANTPDGSGVTPNTGTGRFDSNDMRPEQKLDWSNAVVAVPFRRGSAQLSPAGRAATTGIVGSLTAAPSARVELTGRSSSRHKAGATAADGAVENMDLARARSAAVQAAIVSAGVPAARVLQRNQGEAGAGAGDEWCRVDAQVGSRQMQSPALHETGHMLGNDDEYPVTGSPAGSPIDPSYQAMITATTGEVLVRGRDESAMSVGSTVRRWNYAPFMEALRRISRVQEWTL